MKLSFKLLPGVIALLVHWRRRLAAVEELTR